MAGSLVPIYVVQSYLRPDGTSPTGRVTFDLLKAIEAPEYVSPTRELAVVSEALVVQQLYALDADSAGDPLTPSTLQYRVVEEMLGADPQEFYVTVPAAPPGSRSVADAVVTQGSQLLTSATAAFTEDDEDAYVLVGNGGLVPPGAQISDVVDSTTVQLSRAATAAATGASLLVGASVSLAELRPPT